MPSVLTKTRFLPLSCFVRMDGGRVVYTHSSQLQAAVMVLLASCTLTAGAQGAGADVSAQENPEEAIETLETVNVVGVRNAARYGYVHEGDASTATKTDTPVKQAANAISIVTRRHLDEREPQDLPSTLAYTSGIQRSG